MNAPKISNRDSKSGESPFKTIQESPSPSPLAPLKKSTLVQFKRQQCLSRMRFRGTFVSKDGRLNSKRSDAFNPNKITSRGGDTSSKFDNTTRRQLLEGTARDISTPSMRIKLAPPPISTVRRLLEEPRASSTSIITEKVVLKDV